MFYGMKLGLSDLLVIKEYGLKPLTGRVSLLRLAGKYMQSAKQISIEALMKAQEESKNMR